MQFALPFAPTTDAAETYFVRHRRARRYLLRVEPDGRVRVLPFATPALATAGTGDALAGTILALLAQGLAPFEAATVGAYVHGLAGCLAAEEIGRSGVIASDVVEQLPLAWRKLAGN